LEITIVCKELEIEFCSEHYSSRIQKLIKEAKKPKEKARITCSDSDIIFILFELWEDEILKIPGKGGPEALGKFIHDTFLIPSKEDVKKWMTLKAIKAEIYRLKG